MNNISSVVQAMKISIEIEKEKLIDGIMKQALCDRSEALDIVENGRNKNNSDFFSWWNCGCLHGYQDALNDVLIAIENE